MGNIIDKSRSYFLEHIKNYGKDPYGLLSHVYQADMWADRILLKEKDANIEAIKIAVWLHDIGHYPINELKDHAVTSYENSISFLRRNNCDERTMNTALSCIRSHRAKDIMPVSLEDKLFIVIDSVSHMTDSVYLNMSMQDKSNGVKLRVFQKMERDKRDILTYPQIWKKISKLYNAWSVLLTEYDKI
jgi:23S rRNA maturation-related 3'-5' exoribonuclease YhaM